MQLAERMSNFNFIHSTFESFFNNNSKKFDIVYIDGGHTYECVLEDIKNSLPYITSNGVIAGHDFNNSTGVIKAVEEIFDSKTVEVFSDSTWAVQLK
jgi:hypothetical protein